MDTGIRVSFLRRGRPGLAALLLAGLLAGCGGGSSTVLTTPPAEEPLPSAANPPVGDARNGEYLLWGFGGRESTLSLDFDAARWQLHEGEGADSSGSFTVTGDELALRLDGSTGSSGTPRARLALRGNALVGLLDGPALGVRDFATRVEDIQGKYLVWAEVTVAHAFPTNIVLAYVEIAGRTMRQTDCEVGCPVYEGAISESGGQFTWRVGESSLPFRVGRVGTERVLLQRGLWTHGRPQYAIGLEVAALAPSAKAHVAVTAGRWGEIDLAPERYTLTTSARDGVARTDTGTAPRNDGPPGSVTPSYVIGRSEDGTVHHVNVLATRELLLLWTPPIRMPSFPFSLLSTWPTAPGDGLGRVR